VLVNEGDQVVTGQVLARLDTGRLNAQAAQAAAQVQRNYKRSINYIPARA